MHLLTFIAHPDDAAFTCGGTLAKHANRGDEVTIAYMTRGGWGGGDNEEERGRIREKEARAFADEIGGNAVFMDEKDGRIAETLETRFEIVEMIREQNPDAVITWYPDDPHPDHRITSQLVQDGCFQAGTMGIEMEYDPIERPEVYFVGKPSTSFDPTKFIDITEVIDQKVSALYKHETEIERLEEERGYGDVGELVRTRAAAYGQTCGVSFAEGFIPNQTSAEDYIE